MDQGEALKFVSNKYKHFLEGVVTDVEATDLSQLLEEAANDAVEETVEEGITLLPNLSKPGALSTPQRSRKPK